MLDGFLEDNWGNLPVTKEVILCRELLYAAIIKMLYPDQQVRIKELLVLKEFSDAAYSSGSAVHRFLRSMLPVQGADFSAQRAPFPRRASGPQIDLLIALIEACLNTGPAVNATCPAVIRGGGTVPTLVLVSEGADGLAIGYDIHYDEYSGEIVGCATTTAIEALFAELYNTNAADIDVAEDGQRTDDAADTGDARTRSSIDLERAKRFATVEHKANGDAAVHILTRVDGTVSAPVGIIYNDKTGGSAAMKERHDMMKDAYRRCLSCLKAEKPCDDSGHEHACSDCIDAGVTCVKLKLCILSMDRESGEWKEALDVHRYLSLLILVTC